jgi:putative ABC transport system ATP-binding protein
MTQLTLESVSKAYRRGRGIQQALTDVSLTVSSGELVAVHGEPRSGKSTLLRIAAGIESPDRGLVRYDGRELARMGGRDLAEYRRDAVAWVAASGPSLPGYRARDYVALPALAAGASVRGARSAADEALQLAGAGGCADAGLDELSDTEARCVAIAQALVRRPRMLLADEPVYGLGAVESRRILALFRTLVVERHFGVLVTATEASEVLGATHVVGLSGGGRMLDPTPDNVAAVLEFPARASAGRPDA